MTIRDWINSAKRFALTNRVLFLSLVILTILYCYISISKALIQIEVATDSKSAFKIYWAGESENYSEKRSANVRIHPGKTRYLFLMGNLRGVNRLRLDPANRPADTLIKKIIVRQAGLAPLRMDSKEKFKRLSLPHQIQAIEYPPGGMLVRSDGNDPHLEWRVRPEFDLMSVVKAILTYAALAAILFGCRHLARVCLSDLSFVPYAMVFAVALMLAMAGVSRYNQHPDEHFHIKAAQYYEDHWLPPQVCQPGTESTYSSYGVSRLNSPEIAYLFAGKLSAVFSLLPLEPYLRLRLVNIFLFCVLLWLCLRLPQSRIFFAPLIISAQVWYIFSYYNSDAFALFSAFIACYLLAFERSLLYRFLEETNGLKTIFQALVLAMVLAALLMLKKNYYFFLLFFFAVLTLRVYYRQTAPAGAVWKRVALVVALAAIMVGGRWAADTMVNGLDKPEKLLACRNKLAKPAFKPNTDLEDQYFGLNLKDKGVSAWKVFAGYKWGQVSFQSTFGVFGYMSIYAPGTYYRMVRAACILLALIIIYAILRRAGNQEKLALLIAVFSSLLLIAAAFWNSWTVDLQNQGRYFFPIFAMAGFLLSALDRHLNKRLLNFVLIALFLLSSYSFIFFGLSRIPKIG